MKRKVPNSWILPDTVEMLAWEGVRQRDAFGIAGSVKPRHGHDGKPATSTTVAQNKLFRLVDTHPSQPPHSPSAR